MELNECLRCKYHACHSDYSIWCKFRYYQEREVYDMFDEKFIPDCPVWMNDITNIVPVRIYIEAFYYLFVFLIIFSNVRLFISLSIQESLISLITTLYHLYF